MNGSAIAEESSLLNGRVEKQKRLIDLTGDDFVNISISGLKYEVLKSTLERFPDTLLGNHQRRDFYFVRYKQTLFFDRHRSCFEAILQYYQSGGLLIRPPDIPMHVFEEEVEFFDLGENVLNELKEAEGYLLNIKPTEDPKNDWQTKIWRVFEYPDSSWVARIVAFWSILVISVSIVSFCLETIPSTNNKITSNVEMHNQTHMDEDARQNITHSDHHNYMQHESLKLLEVVCIAWFTFEYVVRLLTSPNKWRFFISLLNIIDLVAVLPYLIIILLRGHSTPYAVIRIVRLVRVFRIFKLSRHYLGLQILGKTLTASASDLGMMGIFLCFGLILFSSGVYYAELEENQEIFVSIPSTFWYTLVTMTTVGYGDHVPKTVPGKLLGATCALCGVLTLAMVVPVIQANFEHYYKRDRFSRKERKKAVSRTSSEVEGGPSSITERLLQCTGNDGGKKNYKQDDSIL